MTDYVNNAIAKSSFFRFIDLDTPLLLSEDPVHEGYDGNLSIASKLNSL